MTRRLTKEELDAQFEKFLKESVSDDSLDFGGPDKQLLAPSSRKSTPKAATLWWQDEQHSSGEADRETTKRRFLKAKKEENEAENVENLDHPVPKPRCRAPEEPVPSLRTRSDRSSTGSDRPESATSSQEGDGRAQQAPGSPPAGSERPADDSGVSPTVRRSGVGLDTLEEEEEKTRFFSQLEARASSTIDYSRLNRELDATGSSSSLRKVEERRDEVPESSRPASGSPHYSEDFHEEETVKEPQEEKLEKYPILSRVALYDSLDDAGGEDRRTAAESVDRGQSYVQSGVSEMEALQEAYQQIHAVEASQEEREAVHRPASPPHPPSSPPHPPSPPRSGQPSLQPPSTAESEFPTAEELMRPIRPEDDPTRGFSLRPISSVGLGRDEDPRLFGKTFTALMERPGHGAGGVTGVGSASPEPLGRDLAWSIRQEVERLMQDQNGPPDRKRAAAAVSHPSSIPVRKPGAAPPRGRTADRKAAAASKTQTSVSSGVQQRRAKPSASRDAQPPADADLKASGELVASVQSLVSVLQQQIDAVQPLSPGSRATHNPPPSSRDEVEELRVQLALKEAELQRMRGGAEAELQRVRGGAEAELQRVRGGAEAELDSLRQQNFVLQSQLRSAEEARQRERLQAPDPAAEARLQQMDREIQEQEALIRGYQQENEKLYLQMKAQRSSSRASEEAMFRENQRLLADLASARDQLKKSWRPAGGVCLMGHAQRITELLDRIQALQRSEASLSEELRSLKAENRALGAELQLAKSDRETDRVRPASGERSGDLQALEVKHQAEVAVLKKKLQWFAENQELLDRDAGRLKAATAEILRLREQMERLREEVVQRSGEQQRKSRARSADGRKMQELQRQVKELELILRSRNPSSLPALIYAAASAGRDDAEGAAASGGRVTALLERKIQRLEAELESHGEEAKRGLRSMEQQFYRVKLQYEQEIAALQQKLQQQQEEAAQPESQTQTQSQSQSQSWASKLQAAEEKLQQEKQTHEEKEKRLGEQVASLQEQLKLKAQSPSRRQRHADEALAARLERLNVELSAKTRSVQELQRTVERLQRERRNMLSRPRRAPQDAFPPAQYDKTYQPTVFTGSHISEVLQEQAALQQQLQRLQQEEEAGRAAAQRAEEELRRVKQQMSAMGAEHRGELERLRADHALQHSSSKVAELSNQLSSQEIAVKRLQEQLQEQRGVREALAASRAREEALQEQLGRLLQELQDATDAQSPDLKLLCGLKRKMLSMELRQQQREKELQQVMGGSWQTGNHTEAERWRRVAQEKSREMESFRLELDSILDILRHLQRQEVGGGVP